MHSESMRTTYHRVHVELGKKERQQIAGMLTKGRESARVLRRALILRQLDQGQTAAQVAGNVGVAPKTSHCPALRRRRIGGGSVRKTATRQATGAGHRPEPADHCHGLRYAARRPGTVERAIDRPRSDEAKTGAAGGPGNDSHPSSEPRSEAVAGKKCGAWRI